eukprot:gnl/TRDRNA2_/TRDRNA2_50435_c0_seq1.p1 gnl/TRDRNA2_/TRDRNA2_50435_c0~~gnl/TRDRNA2_/TRDRNA2_50435_c0_seq1.p1  ORF type:complete len:132 (-),score=28.04 gnl/TRDRNA2_/TRDRNA2_50435_c0_seq1:383-778(-)
MRLWQTLVPCFVGAAAAAKYLIGQDAISGAFEVNFDEEKKDLNLRYDCHETKPCPPVIILTGKHAGTIQAYNCQEGVLYTFVHKGDLDVGIVVQQFGGEHGAKGIPQFGLGQCFCYTGDPDGDGFGKLLCG